MGIPRLDFSVSSVVAIYKSTTQTQRIAGFERKFQIFQALLAVAWMYRTGNK